MHTAADLLERTADHLKCPARAHPKNHANSEPTSITQTLWHAATEGEYPPHLLMPTLLTAQKAINQTCKKPADPTAENLSRAAVLLRTMANAPKDKHAPRYKDAMVPDGRQRETAILYWRDNRVTGLRTADHRRARREAKIGLADQESAETVRNGKTRRYTDKYGDYDL